ncbi:MAG: response regulator [Planctomycetota bacterium]
MKEKEDKSWVLVVDTDPKVRTEIEVKASALGYEVVSLSNGVAAADLALEFSCDAMFIECELPGQSGPVVSRSIRSAEGTHAKRTQIVGMSERPLEDVCIDAGMDAFLAKPFSTEQLEAALRKSLPEA